MNILKLVKSNVVNSVEMLGYTVCDFTVGFPADERYGDIYTNIAMVMAQKLKRRPLDIANEIAEVLQKNNDYAEVNVVAPGFINIRVAHDVWENLLRYVHQKKTDFGSSDLGNNEVINLEFVSANPTGPMHIGHARGAIVGDTIGNLLKKVGYVIVREYYINDAGSQIDKLVESAYIRCIEQLTNTTSDEFSSRNDLYPGEYLNGVASDLVKKHPTLVEMDKSTAISAIRSDVVDLIMSIIREDLSILGIKHDIFTSEKVISNAGLVDESVEFLNQKGLIYSGVSDEPKSEKSSSNWKLREQKLFLATKFGDDVDRCIQKEDGGWTYFAGDIAYHFDKISRGYNKMLVVVGIDHAGYVKRLKAVVAALSDGSASIDVILYGLVKFMNEGTAIKMSKRSGTFLTVRDLIDDVGKDATRFMMVMCGNEQIIDFDLSVVLEHSKSNPVFYVQYAHARMQSVLRHSKGYTSEKISITLLSSKEEIALIKSIARWPSIVESAAINYEPHKIAFYLLDIAEAFHALWGIGNLRPDMKFIVVGNEELTVTRLFLLEAAAYVIASGLDLFNIEPVSEM